MLGKSIVVDAHQSAASNGTACRCRWCMSCSQNLCRRLGRRHNRALSREYARVTIRHHRRRIPKQNCGCSVRARSTRAMAVMRTASATLPSIARFSPLRPRAPHTINDASISSATATTVCQTLSPACSTDRRPIVVSRRHATPRPAASRAAASSFASNRSSSGTYEKANRLTRRSAWRPPHTP